MSYNDGHVHMEFYDKSVDMENLAEDYSEGDDKLKKVLLSLWDNGIITTACCKGHDDGRIAYLSFAINDRIKKIIQATSEYLYLQDGKIELDFESNGKDYNSFTVYMVNSKDKEDHYNFLNSLLSQKLEEYDEQSNILKYGNCLLKFARTMGLNCRFIVEKNNMMFGFSKPDEILMFNDNSPTLDEIITSIKETGNMPLCALNCSEKSLQELINIIYPNTFITQSTIQK